MRYLAEEVYSGLILPMKFMYDDIVWQHLGGPDAELGDTDQCDDHPNLDVSARPWLGLLPFHCKADGYAFKRSLHLHANESIHQHDKGV